MADICYGVVSDNERTSSQSRAARRRRMEIRRVKLDAGGTEQAVSTEHKRQKADSFSPKSTSPISREFRSPAENCGSDGERVVDSDVEKVWKSTKTSKEKRIYVAAVPEYFNEVPKVFNGVPKVFNGVPKFGSASVCGRRRDMEDATSVQLSFFRQGDENADPFHYFGVYDGHGCSHVAMKCRDRLHELVKEELEENLESSTDWKILMEKSFNRMDKEAIPFKETDSSGAKCRCELQTPECDAVGSTAVVAVLTPDKIIVSNCGDSRAVLCRNGVVIPLSVDHKPDRPDELKRIESAGGRVIYWQGPRVLGVLAMSRAIGDNYLKPYVISEPEITITERTSGDECLIIASDGLWDVVSNETACGLARMCLSGKAFISSEEEVFGALSESISTDVAMLLVKLALARQSSDNVSVVVVDLKKGM